jgi:hypothetical protein
MELSLMCNKTDKLRDKIERITNDVEMTDLIMDAIETSEVEE